MKLNILLAFCEYSPENKLSKYYFHSAFIKGSPFVIVVYRFPSSDFDAIGKVNGNPEAAWKHVMENSSRRINDDVPEDFEDLVKEPINNVAEMDQLNADLEDRGFRRRMVNVYTPLWIKSTWSRCVYWHY